MAVPTANRLFKDAVGDLVPDILCGVGQSLESPINYINNLRDGILGTETDPNNDAAGFRNGLQKMLCDLGPNPQNPTFDGVPSQPGNCNTLYNGVVEYTQPRIGGSPLQLTQPFVDAQGPGLEVDVRQSGSQWIMFLRNAAGTEQEIRRGTSSFNPFTEPFISDLERKDGGVDQCGPDGTPESYEPPNPSGSGDLEYPDNDGNPVVEPYTFDVRPITRNPSGDLVAPIELCFALFCIQVSLNLSTGDIEFGDRTPAADECCPPIGDAGDDPGADDPDGPENDVRFVGVVTRCTIGNLVSTVTEIGDGDGPSLFIPRLGVIRFLIQVGGRTAYTMDQPIKTLAQFTEVNAPTTAYGWTILPEKGVDIIATGVPVAE